MLKVRHQELESSIKGTTVKINFEKCDELLAKINADNDTIYLKLDSNLEVSALLVSANVDTNKIFFSERLRDDLFNNFNVGQHIQRQNWETQCPL